MIDEHLAAIGIEQVDVLDDESKTKAGELPPASTVVSAESNPAMLAVDPSSGRTPAAASRQRKSHRVRPPALYKPVFAASTSTGSSAMSAASSFARPPRVYYGFCSVPGEGREGSTRSGDCATDRVVVVDSFCGQRSQTLAVLVDGHGFAGAQVAEAVAAGLPDVLAGCATRVPRRKRRRRKAGGAEANAASSGGLRASGGGGAGAASSMEARARRLLGPASVSTLLLSSSAPVLPPASLRRLAPSASPAVVAAAPGRGGSLAWRQAASGVRLAPLAELVGRAAALERRACATMRRAFARVHRALAAADDAGGLDASFSGASALAVVVREDLLVAGHAGLCRAVVGHAVPEALALSTAARALSTADARRVALGPSRAGVPGGARRTALPGEVLPVPEGQAQGWARAAEADLEALPGFPAPAAEWGEAAGHPAQGIGARPAGTATGPEAPTSATTRLAPAPSGTAESGGRVGSAGAEAARGLSAPERRPQGPPFDPGERVAAAPLTVDHRPDRPDEMARVQALGARVEYFRYEDGTLGQLPRLFADHSEGPGLPLSRGLGFCDPVAARAGVVSEPEVSVRRLTRADRFVVLGSDGLWSALGSAEAVAIVEQTARAVLWGGSAGAGDGVAGGDSVAGGDGLAGGEAPGPLGASGLSETLAGAGASRPVLPPLAHEASVITVPQASVGAETVAWGAADEGPVTGMGGGSAAASVPARGCSDAARASGGESNAAWLDADWDLAELLLPEHVRRSRQTRLQRLAAAAAEAVCAAAIENDRVRTDHRGRRDDITAIVLWLDHAPKQQ